MEMILFPRRRTEGNFEVQMGRKQLVCKKKKMQDLIPDLMILKGWAVTHNH